MNPLITIITACYNSEHFLERSIQSVLAQTYENIEYIIIDGDSTDGTVAVIKKYEDRIHHWISEKDLGVYDAWNKGIKMSKGEWITFIGSDDVLYPDAMEKYVAFLNNSKEEYDYVSSKMHIIGTKGEMVRTLGKAWNWSEFRTSFIVAHPGSLHARAYFQKYGTYDPSFKICGDYDMLLRAGEALKAGYLNYDTIRMSLGGLSDTSKVFDETYKAMRYTAGVSAVEAKLVIFKLWAKYYIKHFFRFFNIYIKK